MRVGCAEATAVAALGLWLASGCGGSETHETVIDGGCGPGTRLDPDTQLCVVDEADAGGEAGTAGSGGNTAGDASVPDTSSAGMGGGGQSGAAGAGTSGSAGSAGAGPTVWVDDECSSYKSEKVLSQADPNCPDYDPQGVCALGAAAYEIEPLTVADFDAVGELIVRTPSNPGSMPQCEDGCAGPGTISWLRIPIDIPTPVEDPDVIVVEHVGVGGNQTGEPWRVVYGYEESGSEVCSSLKPSDCVEIRTAQVVIQIETDVPDAPAREFRLTYQDAGGICP